MWSVTYIGNMQRSADFGESVRRLREERETSDRSFSLRGLAQRCGVSPAYLSRVERGEVAPPGEETLIRLADELEVDRDVMLAMGGKISGDLRTAILSRPKLFGELIRSLQSLPDHAVLRLVREVRDGNW